MSESDTYRTTDSNGQTILKIGNHSGIQTPFFAPELKNWFNDLHVTLDQRDVLEENNPIFVPGWDWERLRQRSSIQERKDDNGNEIGEEEVEELEANHPVIYFEPPEFYAYPGRAETLRRYILKRDSDNKKQFEEEFRNGSIDAALSTVPEFTRPFLRTNLSRIADEVGADSKAIAGEKQFGTSEEAWLSLEKEDYNGFFGLLAEEAAKRPSSVVVPPVPQISRNYDTDLVTALCTANRQMNEATGEDTPSYFHLYLNYSAFFGNVDEDSAEKIRKVVEKEVKKKNYTGIALTLYKAERAFDSDRQARVETFLEYLSDFTERQGIPLVCPRSEWFGLFATDYGVDGFSSLYNGNWMYRSGGGSAEYADQYGYTVIQTESRALKLKDDNDDDIEEYLESSGVPSMSGLPNEPDGYNPHGDSLKEKYGTPFEYRRSFGKPMRLNHIWETQQVRQNQNLTSRPAEKILKSSENRYVEFREENQDLGTSQSEKGTGP